MTELAYMTHADWAQGGRGMVEQSGRIRKWLDAEPYVFLDFSKDKRGVSAPANAAFADSVAPEGVTRIVVGSADLREYAGAGDKVFDHSLVVVHPHEQRECELLQELIVGGRIKRIFVSVWSSFYLVKDMLDGLGALNLFDGSTVEPVDPLQRAAAEAMLSEEYNGLKSGRGKDSVIQLLRAFRDEGYLLDETWVRAVFAAGGSYRSAQTVASFLREMNDGVKHRVRPHFVDGIVDVLRSQVARSQ